MNYIILSQDIITPAQTFLRSCCKELSTEIVGTAKFKTNIKCSGCVEKVTPFLNESLGVDNWKVDTNGPSKILTVVNEKDRVKIIQAVERAGYKQRNFEVFFSQTKKLTHVVLTIDKV